MPNNMNDQTEEAEETFEETQEEVTEDSVNEQEDVEKLKGSLNRLYKQNKELKKQLEENKHTTPPVEEKDSKIKSNEPDYATRLAVKTYLNQQGITHPDDQKRVMDEAARLNLPPDEVASMAHIKNELKDASDQREAESGVPRGTARRSGTTKNDLEYWLAKDPNEPGSTPDDLELANKVIDARIAKQEQTSKFSEDLYSG